MCNRLDARRHRGGEQRGLFRRRRLFQNRIEIFCKPHVEHFVGFIQDDDLHLRQLQALTTNMIEGPPRCRDDDIDPALEGLELRPHGLTAVERQDARAEFLSISLHRIADLYGQFTGGHKNQSGGIPFDSLCQTLQQRQ